LIAISIPIPLITIGWIAASVLIGLIAMAKGRSFISWSVAAAVASPFVVLLLFVLPKPKQIRQAPPAPPNVAPPPRAAAPGSNAALSIKTIKALAYRVKSSGVVGSISRRKAAAYRSLETFAAAAEIDKGIAAAVREEFPNKPAAQIPTERKIR
jgi:hypothetical protein